QGKHYQFSNLSMDPKPVQPSGPPVVFGAVTPAGARRAIRCADGLYPLFLDPTARPDRYLNLQDEIRREAERIGKSTEGFHMLCAASGRLTDTAQPTGQARSICTGSVDQVLEDLAGFADNGYSLVVLALDCPSKTRAEFIEQIERFGQEVIPEASRLTPSGEWQPVD
ncbi:MAG TPA: LLM class flavin-dependent oxidoreductase, partial [Candidatus Thioglobus sp.]|nr:LLM class flavin-dependent oxidoreductase [Candidatus Thioglobus sp.]